MVYIQAILALIPLVKEIVDWIKEISKDDPAKFLTDLHEAIADTRKTKDVKKLQDLIGKM